MTEDFDMKAKRRIKFIISNVIITIIALIMIYPLVWMVMSSFKQSNTIFQTAGQLFPTNPTIENYINGFKGFGNVPFWKFFRNSFFLSIVGTIGTVLSSSLVGYGFSRFKFKGRGILFGAMLVTMMLPSQILMVPQYLWFQKLGWVGTYLPILVPCFFATQGFFVYMIKNFIDGIPRELDDAAKIDGCSSFGIYARIIMPLSIPTLVNASIFSFIWSWDDFLGALLYITDTDMYPVSLALKLFCDPSSSSDYGAMFAMATLAILPSVIIFLCLQKYLVEGISTSGLKG